MAVAPGFDGAYKEPAAGGWVGLTGSPEYGGQGPAASGHPGRRGDAGGRWLPCARPELHASGAIAAIEAHATEEGAGCTCRGCFLSASGPRRCARPNRSGRTAAAQMRAESGMATAIVCLGEKIFITWGDHDLTSNVVHLAPARATAAGGSSGYFFVPSAEIQSESGWEPGRAQTHIRPVSVEHKLGLHASLDADGFGEEGGAVAFWPAW